MNEAKRYPEHIDMDLSTKCNLRCRFCHLSYYKPKAWLDLDTEQFSRLRPLLPHLRSITLFSKFEPLTCRDFIPIFEEICQHDLESYFSTNGVLLNEEVRRAIVGRLTFLTVSVTGFTREEYVRNMGQDRLEQVRHNLAELNRLKNERGTKLPRLRISTVGMLDTLDGLRGVVDFAREFNASEGVQVTYLKAHGKETLPLMPLKAPERYQQAASEAAEYARSLGVPFQQQGGTIDENRAETAEIGHRTCAMPWQRLSLQPNGDAYPCPLTRTVVGNWLEQPIEEIWNGTPLAEFRKGVNDPRRMNEECRNCTHCRHRDVLNDAANDFTDAQEYVVGMTRK